jgi:uncharacterized membrane protein (DUF441 family)
LWLLITLITGLVADSKPAAAAAGLLLLLKLTGFQSLLPYIQRWGSTVGLVLLVAVTLLPIAQGRYSTLGAYKSLLGPVGVGAVLCGLLASYLAGRGLNLLELNPELLLGLMLGSLLGVVFFRGVPQSPFAGAGLLFAILGVLSMVRR